MKTIYYRIILSVLVALGIFSAAARAQQQYDPTTIVQELDMRIDEMGDAHMELRMKMNASQWMNFKNSMSAQNPTVFMRDLERSMVGVLLEEFRNELLETNRTSVTTIKARNMALYKGDNRWELKLDMKEPNITKISDHVYLISGNLLMGGSIAQQMQKIFFPEKASNIKQDTDTYGNAIFTYNLKAERSSINILFILGILLCVGGVVMFILPFLRKKSK